MRIRCPHCHNPLEVLDDDPLCEVDCPSCGSRFSFLGNHETASWQSAAKRRIGQFELLEQVGAGHFGSVWKSRDTTLDRLVAVKVPRRNQVDVEHLEQFLREGRAAAQLRHPNIVPVHEIGQADGSVYIVSDFIDGCSLREWLSGQRMTPREAGQVATKVAVALHHAHEAGVIHRDVKPGNIMLDLSGEPHLMDFGLARRESGEITMTVDGRILGTPAYMSPEQARGEAHRADRRSDVYSLGVVLYEMLTGELPFRGDTRMLIVQILKEEPPPPRRLNSHIPRDLETICLKCLQKSPDRRYQSAAELADDLSRWLDGRPIQARPVGRAERLVRWARREPRIATLAATTLLVTFLGFAGVTWQWRKTVAANAAVLTSLEETKKQSARRELNFDRALEAVDKMLTHVGERQLANSPELAPVRKAILEDALKLYEGLLQENGTDPQVQLETASAAARVSAIHLLMRDYPAATAGSARAIDILEPMYVQRPQDAAMLSRLSHAYLFYARTLREGGHDAQALQAFDEAREFTRPHVRRSLEGKYHELTRLFTDASWNYAQLLIRLGRHDEAERPLREIIQIAERNLDANNYGLHAHWFQYDLASVLKRKPETKQEGEQAELRSIEIMEQAAKKFTVTSSTYVGLPHVYSADTYYSSSAMLAHRYELYAQWLRGEGRGKEADEYLAKATATREAGVQKLSQNLVGLSKRVRQQGLANSYQDLAGVMLGQGKRKEAIEHVSKAIEVYEELVKESPRSPSLKTALLEAQLKLATWLAADPERWSEGHALLGSIRAQSKSLGATLPGVEGIDIKILGALKSSAWQARSTSGMAAAEPAIREALALAEQMSPEDLATQSAQESLLWCHHNLGDALQFTQQKGAEAASHYEQSRVIQEGLIGKQGLNRGRAVDLGWTCQNGGNALLATKPDGHLVGIAVRGVEMREYLVGLEESETHHSALNDSFLLLGRALAWVADAQSTDMEKAASLAATRTERTSDHNAAWRALGIARFRQENYGESVTAMNRAAAGNLHEPAIDRFYLAMALARAGKGDEAQQHLDAGNEWVQKHRSAHPGFRALGQQAAAVVGGE